MKTQTLIGIQKLLRVVGMAIGWKTILTGHCPEIAIGAHHYQSGDAKKAILNALDPEKS